MTFSISESSGNLPGNNEYNLPSYQRINVSGKMSYDLNYDMFIKIDRNNGGSVLSKIAEAGDDDFDLSLWFKNTQPGIMHVSYSTFDGEKVHTSKAYELVIAPVLEDKIGYLETINVEVGSYDGQSKQSEQTTNNNRPGGGGGGCNAGFGGLLFAMLAGLAVLIKK